ncbi:hypothetical protein HDE_04908 [Halotydeus destructor]|nr:hypothetical protein HDE_04908 [Halotydeus destructor]
MTIAHSSRATLSISETNSSTNSRSTMAVIVLANLMAMTYAALDITLGEVSPSFAVKGAFHLSTLTGAHLSATYWATFTLGRILAIFYDGVIGRLKEVFLSLSLCVLASDLLIPYGDKSEWTLIVGVALAGMGLASMYASLIGYLEDHLTLTDKMAAGIGVSSTLGEVLITLTIGVYLEQDPDIFLYVVLFCTCSLCFTFFVISSICESNSHTDHLDRELSVTT